MTAILLIYYWQEGSYMTTEIYTERLRRLGLKISYYRKLRGLTQEQLAEKVGISWSQLAKMETGTLRLMWVLADTLSIPLDKLFADD